MSLRQACRILSLSRTVFRYQPDTQRDEPVIMALTVAAERYPRYGFKKLFQVLRRQGKSWNHKRVHRIYCLLKLNFRRKGKQRLPVRNPAPLATPEAMNQSWSIDFMHDALVCGRRFRTFNVVDDFNREALAIEIDLNIPAQRVVRVLDRIVANRGYPLKMRMDNGPELVSLTLAQWAEEHGVMLEFIRPGKPTQNAFIERFNRTYRTEILDFYLFRTLNEAREITERWLAEYNGERPHESLNNLTPEEYRLMAETPEISKVRGTKTGVLTCGHGFRTMARGAMGESGLWSDDAIERQLSHSERNKVRAAYIHTSEHLDERRLMVQWWANYLEESRVKMQRRSGFLTASQYRAC